MKKFRLEFPTDGIDENLREYLPFEDNTVGEFCIFENCDKQFKEIIKASAVIPYKLL